MNDIFQLQVFFDPLIPNAPCFYPLKALGNSEVFWLSQGVEKVYIENEWIKKTTTFEYF